jgi:hypothetical protein
MDYRRAVVYRDIFIGELLQARMDARRGHTFFVALEAELRLSARAGMGIDRPP